MLRKDLDLPSWEIRASRHATQAVGQFNEESFVQEDVRLIHRAYGLGPHASDQVHVRGIKGYNGSIENAGEGSLDLQVIMPLSPGAPTTWWGISPFYLESFMISYASQLNDDPKPPLVHSISWGDAEAVFPPQFIDQLDYQLMKLAIRGITMISASGDNGISSIPAGCNFVSDILGSSPWVTVVGATMPSLASAPYCAAADFHQVLGSCEEPGPVVCSIAHGAMISSSGYVSLYRQMPTYQVEAVREYLKSSDCAPCRIAAGMPEAVSELLAPCQHLDANLSCELGKLLHHRRFSPDVALPGQAFPTIVNGSLYAFDGTSASAPALAALISLLNSRQIRAGRPPLGFLNPWLYKMHARHADVFVDVVVGDTSTTEAAQCPFGWTAAAGWDAATGLGVPRFSKLLDHLPMPGQGIAKGWWIQDAMEAQSLGLDQEISWRDESQEPFPFAPFWSAPIFLVIAALLPLFGLALLALKRPPVQLPAHNLLREGLLAA